MNTSRISQLVVGLMFLACVSTGHAQDLETGTSSIQTFKKNYILFNSSRGSNDDGEFKLQLSFLTLFKAHEFQDKLMWFDINSNKVLNVGFNYTQTFFNDFGLDSSPVVATDYLPGLFVSLHSRGSAFAGFKQFLFGWEHQSNGEFQGEANRSWDRGFGEILLGFGRSFAKDQQSALQHGNLKSLKNVRFGRMGDDRANLRLRVTWPINISEDNLRIRDFYGVTELEASIRDQHHEASVTMLGGHVKQSFLFEISSKRIPGLADLNERWNQNYRCQEQSRSGLKQRLVCLARYVVAPFDLADNHGAWMLQYFNGYGEHIRNFDVKENDVVRIGYRFSMLGE